MTSTLANRRVHLRIKGRVQGVWFRQSTREEAERLGVFGWVRNLPDGDVEAVLEGPEQAVETLVRWCHTGPPGARVTGVERTDETPIGEFGSFEVRR
ncbi:MAG: acylphosphatase [Myxococcaceae bacterium]|nr:acylphosphatase [Myxococcaceae bacterium]